MLIAMTLLFLVYMAVGYVSVFWRDRADRITVSICLTFMNFTLAIFLAGQYFPEPNVLVPVILSVLPWSLLLIPFRALSARMSRQ
jgi:predicted Na+-dependent transporter